MPNGPRKIILINAGKYDYAEVDLGGSLQIVGPNNTGKTTLINTLQFLYLNDARTMDFGSYDLAQTFAYYFPNQYSYVLFECLGSTGKCVIGWRGQSKASGGEPERFCYLGEYQSDDFFDAKRQVREPRDINARLALQEFRPIKSAAEHREMLLPPASGEGKGLGIVALREAERYPRFRESLKDLLSLGTITQEQMRERLLTLAEVPTDKPALDVRKLFGDDYDKIRRHRDALARFRKNEEPVRRLVERFDQLAGLRGELISRWDDLRNKRLVFEQKHEARLLEMKSAVSTQENLTRELGEQSNDRHAERDAQILEKGTLSSKLKLLETQAAQFADFNPDLAEIAKQNLEKEELRLKNLLAEAETESRDKAKTKVELYRSLVQQKEQSIANFDRLAVTALRRQFKDDELARAFRLLNFDLLETPLGKDGITPRHEQNLWQTIRALAGRVRDGIYEDADVTVVLPTEKRTLTALANVEALREQLTEESHTLRRWEKILQAITERETLAAKLQDTQKQLAEVRKQIVLHGQFLLAQAEEPRLKRDLHLTEEALGKLTNAIADLGRKREKAREAAENARNGIRAEENAFNQIMGRFGDCLFPEFAAQRAEVDDLPGDFDTAISYFLKRQEKERETKRDVENLLAIIAQLVGEQYNGADEAETVSNLAAELEALPDKTQMLEKDWNALIQGLRAQFGIVLRELDAVRSAVTDLNKQFAKVQVSNLQSIKLEVLEAGDLVNWIKRLVHLQQPGLFDDDTQLDQTLRNFRQKLEGSPLISFSQLFSLQFTIEGADGVKHHYQDFRQIESHGTTITIKVLFNLLVLRRYLREDQCVVPFFLDEIQALDPANRAAVLSTARKLGFLAITAAPEAVTEVESLYFLQPTQGRIVLRQRHRIGVKLK